MLARLGLLVSIAAKHISQRTRQTVVAVAGVGVGVGFFLAVSSLMVGSQNDFVKTLIDAAPHIIISDEVRSPPPQPARLAYAGAAVAIRSYKPRNEVRGIKNWQEITRTIERMPEARASPSLSGAVTLRVGGRDEAFGIIGVEPGIESEVSDVEEDLKAGRLRNLETTQGGVIIGEDMAERLGVGMGDIVAATSRAGTRTLKLVGLIARGRSQVGGGTGYVLLREAQSLTGQPFVINRIGIRLDDPYRSEAVAARLEARFGYKAESWQERSADFLSLLVTRNVIMYSVVSAILLVASFGIYTVVSTSVANKQRDIAIMRSMGFSAADLERIFVIEGFALACVGVLAGWALGFALMQVLGSLEFPIQGRVEKLPLDRSFFQYAVSAMASLSSAVIAAWIPARKAARVDPVDILRGAV